MSQPQTVRQKFSLTLWPPRSFLTYAGQTTIQFLTDWREGLAPISAFNTKASLSQRCRYQSRQQRLGSTPQMLPEEGRPPPSTTTSRSTRLRVRTPNSVIVLYGTGEGQTTPSGIEGAISGLTPPWIAAVLPVAVVIGGEPDH
ncbi:MAG: hypothetical protein JWN34_2348 [Bryobacterales bacterium]|nr:hypothetical protein [Bryobacterales bacterium]